MITFYVDISDRLINGQLDTVKYLIKHGSVTLFLKLEIKAGFKASNLCRITKKISGLQLKNKKPKFT